MRKKLVKHGEKDYQQKTGKTHRKNDGRKVEKDEENIITEKWQNTKKTMLKKTGKTQRKHYQKKTSKTRTKDCQKEGG